MSQQIILHEMQLLPEHLQMEVLHYLLFLKNKHLEQKSTNGKGALRPYFGCGKVHFTLAADFDAPLEDFKEYM